MVTGDALAYLMLFVLWEGGGEKRERAERGKSIHFTKKRDVAWHNAVIQQSQCVPGRQIWDRERRGGGAAVIL